MAKKKQVENEGWWAKSKMYAARVKEFFSNGSVQFVLGLLCAGFVVYLASSFISFFSMGGCDQSVVEALASGASSDDAAGNLSGKGGAVLAGYLVNNCFGWASVLVLPLLLLVAVSLMRLRKVRLGRWAIITFFAVVWFSILFSMLFEERLGFSFVSPGGKHGDYIKFLLTDLFGVVGVVLFLLLSLLIFMIYLTSKTIPWLRNLLSFVAEKPKDEALAEESEEEPASEDEDDVLIEDDEDELDEDDENEEDGGDDDVEDVVDEDLELARKFDDMNIASQGGVVEVGGGLPAQNEAPALSMEVEAADGDNDTGGKMIRPLNPKDELSYYKPPTLDLLDEYEQGIHSIDRNEQAENANNIVKALSNFGIEISSIKATVGPTITLYEITPAPGVRISKIRNLEDD